MHIERHEIGPRFSEMTVVDVGTGKLVFIAGQVAENTALDIGGQTREVLGFIDRDGHGMSGMERVLDHRLTDPLTRGRPAALSIDSRVQAAVEGEESSTTRTTLRLPDELKSRVEAAAAHAGVSVNTWLVRTIASALDSGASRTLAQEIRQEVNKRVTGWVR